MVGDRGPGAGPSWCRDRGCWGLHGGLCVGHAPQSRGRDTALRLALTLGVLVVDGGCPCSCTQMDLSQRIWEAPSLPTQWRPGVSAMGSGSPSSSWVGGGSRPQWGEKVGPFLWAPPLPLPLLALGPLRLRGTPAAGLPSGAMGTVPAPPDAREPTAGRGASRLVLSRGPRAPARAAGGKQSSALEAGGAGSCAHVCASQGRLA